MLKVDIEDKTIQDLVAKINHKVQNGLYNSVREFTVDYFVLGSLIYGYNIEHSSVNLLDFIDKLPNNFPEYNEDTFKWKLEEPKPESNE